jgi:hypothetical protein
LTSPYAGLNAGIRRSETELVDAREVSVALVANEFADATLTGMVTGCGPSNPEQVGT